MIPPRPRNARKTALEPSRVVKKNSVKSYTNSCGFAVQFQTAQQVKYWDFEKNDKTKSGKYDQDN